MPFVPPFCPHASCSEHEPTGSFRFQHRGSYRRSCDGMRVPRFSCCTCERRFSRQTFRFNYRWWRPHVHHDLFRLFVSKVTMRQAARITGLSRDTIARRMRALGVQCHAYHRAQLARGSGLAGTFLMDEMETFETDRLVRPVTVPVLIQAHTLFVIHTETAPLPPRGRLDAYRQLRKLRDERRFGPRKSGSRQAVRSTLERLRETLARTEVLNLITDRKSSYRKLVWTLFANRFGSHVQESSQRRRDRSNPLFSINHTLAMLRDGVSRLVRRSWGASKLRERLDDHLWIWVGYRNYVRGITARETRITPAMAAGVTGGPRSSADLFRWRWADRFHSETASGSGQHPGGVTRRTES